MVNQAVLQGEEGANDEADDVAAAEEAEEDEA